MKKLILTTLVFATLSTALYGCSDANMVSHNLSKDADYFRLDRRIVFYNGITGEYMLSIEGKCSLGNFDTAKEITVTCRTGQDEFKKHFLGLSDNVTYFVEQLDGKNVSPDHYKVIFKPGAIIPEFEMQ